jgi:ferredoxin--NADP+ reductase
MRLQELDTSTQYQAHVLGSKRITPEESDQEVRDIEVEISEDLSVEAGQNIGVLAPGSKEFGQSHHLRLYTIADLPTKTPSGGTRIHLCVKRCWYIDQYSGERYPGVASHFLCDLQPGDELTITGPYGQAFEAPEEPDATLILIGAGTGIAPFRAFIRHLYQKHPEFSGKIWLFHGARTGLELLYMNDLQNDFAQYYDRSTFEAIAAYSERPHWTDAIDWHGALASRGEEIWNLLADSKTYVYLAGLEQIRDELDSVFREIAGTAQKWSRRRAELVAGKRWVELLY